MPQFLWKLFGPVIFQYVWDTFGGAITNSILNELRRYYPYPPMQKELFNNTIKTILQEYFQRQ